MPPPATVSEEFGTSRLCARLSLKGDERTIMRFAPAADWREQLPFETPIVLAEVVPGDDARCFTCGPDSEARPRTDVWAYKHQHPNHHHGFVRLYCVDHVPARPVAPPPAAAPVRGGTRPARSPRPATPRAERAAPARRANDFDRVRAMCPDCFVEVNANGLCGVCGNTVGA